MQKDLPLTFPVIKHPIGAFELKDDDIVILTDDSKMTYRSYRDMRLDVLLFGAPLPIKYTIDEEESA